MELFINLCGLIGVWLLFTYPMYQAYLELFDQTLTFAAVAVEKVPSIKKFRQFTG